MIQFHTLRITNFFSIDEATLDLSKNGITLITGSIKGKGAFESNGAGKSSLIEALVWLIHGRTIRDLPADDNVIRTGELNCKVQASVMIDEKPFVIMRVKGKGRPVSLTILDDSGEELFAASSVVEKTKMLERMLKYDFNTFCNTVYFPQGRFTFFTEANDADRKKIFDQVLGTEYFQNLEKRAKELKNEARDQMLHMTTQLETLDYRLKGLSEMIEQTDGEIARLNETRESNRKEEARYVKEIQTKLDAEKIALADVVEKQKKLEGRRGKLEEARTRYVLLDKQRSALESQKGAETRHLQDALQKATAAKDKGRKFASLMESGQCPTCRQRFVDEDSLQTTVTEMSNEIDQADAKSKEQEEAVEKLETQLAEVKEWLRALAYDPTALDTLNRDAARLETAHRERKANIASFTASIETAESSRERREKGLKEELEAKIAVLKKHSDNAVAIRVQIEGLKGERGKLEVRIGHLEFWIVGFGPRGLRSLIFENVLPYLNQRANLYVSKLTGGDVTITIAATTALKSGESRERISVQAVNARGASVYEGNSGGEKRRIDLAILLALQDLIATRHGASINLALYDEIFDALDDEGIERVVGLLREMSERKPILIISHSSALKGYFEDTIEIKKTNGVSRLVA